MYNQRDHQVHKIIEFLKQSEINQKQGVSIQNEGLSYVLSYIGRLFVQQYRVLEFLPHKLVLFVKNMICNEEEKSYLVMKLEPRNRFRNERQLRLRTYETLSKAIDSLPMKGTYKALILYIEDLCYSLLSVDQLKAIKTPEVHYFKHMSFMEQYSVNQRLKNIDCKQAGTLLHSLMEFYILENGYIKNQDLIKQINTSHLTHYQPTKAVHTVNYIIGLQMIKGGYDIMNTEKLLQTTNLLVDERSNFNRLDLILRNQQKVLVIDWKFSAQKAKDYMKGYRHKVQKYLTLAKKYYRCQVQFHLYCIHALPRGKYFYQITTQTIHKRVDTVQLTDALSQDDIWVVESEVSPPKIVQQPILFQLNQEQLNRMNADEIINKHFDEQIQKQLAEEQKQNQQYHNMIEEQQHQTVFENKQNIQQNCQKPLEQQIYQKTIVYQMQMTQAIVDRQQIKSSLSNSNAMILEQAIQLIDSQVFIYEPISVRGDFNRNHEEVKFRKESKKTYAFDQNRKETDHRQIQQKAAIFIDLEEPIQPIVIQID